MNGSIYRKESSFTLERIEEIVDSSCSDTSSSGGGDGDDDEEVLAEEQPLAKKESRKPKRKWRLSLADQYVLLCILGSFCFGYTISCLNTLEQPIAYALKWCVVEPNVKCRSGLCGRRAIAEDSRITTVNNNTDGNVDEFVWEGGEQVSIVSERQAPNFQCSASESRFFTLNVVTFLTAAVGSCAAGLLSNFGRKLLNWHVYATFLIGSVVQTSAASYTVLIIGRAFQGLAAGGVNVATPLFISEISPLEKRGSRGVYHQLAMTFGIATGILPGIAFHSEDFSNPLYEMTQWRRALLRLVFAVPALVSGTVLLLMCSKFRSETPQFLVRSRKFAEAHFLLQEIYGRSDVSQEVADITMVSSAMLKTELSDGSYGFRKLFCDPWYRAAFLTGVGLFVAQQSTGINTFVSGSSGMLHAAGMPTSVAPYASAALFIANIVFTFIPVSFVDKAGRVTLLSISFFGQFLSFIAPLLYDSIVSRTATHHLLFGSLLGFISSFSMGAGPISWVYINEIFPQEIQGIAVGLCAAVHWLTGLLMIILLSYLNSRGKFAACAVLSVFGLLFIQSFVKETKQRPNAKSPYLDGRPHESGTDSLLRSYYAAMSSRMKTSHSSSVREW